MGNDSVKPYKVRSCQLKARRLGIVASSLDRLLKEACLRLKVDVKTKPRFVLEEDATEVDTEEYFQQLPAQTCLVLVTHQQTWTPYRPSPRVVLDELLKLNQSRLAEEISALLHDVKSQHQLNLLAGMSSNLQMTNDKETKLEDPDWFKGLEERFTNKEDVMREGARRRVRGYYYSVSDFIRKSDIANRSPHCSDALSNTLDRFRKTLKNNDYNSVYFGRKTDNPDATGRFCDSDGWFRCEGLFNKPRCDSVDHMINPYGSREARLEFSTWNLDHRVEKSRSVSPALINAHLAIPSGQRVNWEYFYELLFTRANLKLVHIVCHDKSEHDGFECDVRHFYVHSTTTAI